MQGRFSYGPCLARDDEATVTDHDEGDDAVNRRVAFIVIFTMRFTFSPGR